MARALSQWEAFTLAAAKFQLTNKFFVERTGLAPNTVSSYRNTGTGNSRTVELLIEALPDEAKAYYYELKSPFRPTSVNVSALIQVDKSSHCPAF